MLFFDGPKNMTKAKVFRCFQGESKGNIEKRRVKTK